MELKLYSEPLKDEVLGATYWVGHVDYEYAIHNLYPLIQRLDTQRGLQNPSFYSRLRNDLKVGCVVPPITIAFITEKDTDNFDESFVIKNINHGFILDGIQRLNAIQKAHEEIQDTESRITYLARTLHLNIIISPSMDRLLYRMITLNNGQKPMSPRHQIDILSETIFDFESLEIKNQAHKQRQKSANKLAIHRSDIVKGYIAYLSNTTVIDSKLIIEEKMDDLIADRIIGSDMGNEKYEFVEILKWISTVCKTSEVNQWFVASNNFIGFCVAARGNFEFLQGISSYEFKLETERFESVFTNFDKRKIKVGDYRRKMVAEYFSDVQQFSTLNESDIVLELSQR